MSRITRALRRHTNYLYYAFRAILRLDVLPTWAIGKRARVTCLVLLGAIFVSYISITSIASSGGYKMRDLEKESAELKEEIKKIDVQIAQYSSLGNLEEKIKETHLVAVDDINYLTSDAPAVAKK